MRLMSDCIDFTQKVSKMTRSLYPQNNEIAYLEANINYTIFHLGNGKKFVSSTTLKRHAAKEDLQHFVRVNRSILLNPEHISKLSTHGRVIIIRMSNGTELQVSRRKKSYVKRLNL